jgi:electron transfer flavoprotein beta subunit
MRIVVCIKQVPETSDVRMDEETGTIVREGVESIVNPMDLYAVELSLLLRDETGGRVTAVTMGPPGAGTALREALSMGCDDAVLVSGRQFAGSDTYATSLVLSRTVTRLAPFDLLLMGVGATDGETSQVGPGVASLLNLPLCTYTSRVLGLGGDRIGVERLVEDGYEALSLPMPAVLTVGKEIGYPRLPTLHGKQRARAAEVPVWSAADLGIEGDAVGSQGSPTRVVQIGRPRVARDGRRIQVKADGAAAAARELADFLEERNLL